MAYPTSLDSFTELKDKSDSVTQSFSMSASASAFTITVDHNILSTVSFDAIYTTEVSTTPTAGQFRVLYNTKNVEMGPLAADITIDITYVTKGSTLSADHITALQTAVENIQSTLGLNPQGSFTDLVARVNDIANATVMSLEQEDFTSDCDGAAVVFSLVNTPRGPKYVRVFLNGIKRRLDTDYIIDGSNVVFSEAPEAGDTLDIEYYWIP